MQSWGICVASAHPSMFASRVILVHICIWKPSIFDFGVLWPPRQHLPARRGDHGASDRPLQEKGDPYVDIWSAPGVAPRLYCVYGPFVLGRVGALGPCKDPCNGLSGPD